jgi:hypothetical protein
MGLVYNTRIQMNSAVAYEGATAMCVEMDNSVYEFRTNAPVYAINNTSVLATGAGGNSRWLGISGRGKYNSHRNLLKAKPDMTVSKLSDLKALTASENIQVFCVDTGTIYNYYYSLPNVPINGLSVVDVNSSSVARWIGIYGVYTYVNLDNINFIEEEFEGTGSGGGISITDPYLVFYQEFPNSGGPYTVTGVSNGVLGLPFDPAKIIVSKTVSIVLPNGNPVYDNLFPRTKSHIVTGSIDNSGLVTLSSTPYNGYSAIRVYFYYEITTDETLSAYYRDDIVTEMEASLLEFAKDVQIEDATDLFPNTVTNVEDALANLKEQVNNTVITVEDEGTPLAQRQTINFTGTGVAAVDSGGKTVVTINSGAAADATAVVKGVLKLTNDLGGTADLPTVPGIETNAVINRFRRGYNNTGSTINAFKFVSTSGGYISNYPYVQASDFTKPCLGVLAAPLLTGTATKIQYYGLFQFGVGILDTTSVPLQTPVYVSPTGDLTLSYSALKAGETKSQGTSPWVLLNVQYYPERYTEFPFTGITTNTFNHNFARYPEVTILSGTTDITSSVVVTHPNKNSVTLVSNIPITGTLICSCD